MNVQDRSNTFDLNKYGVGQPVRRTEDPVLVQGQGRYTDDLNLPGQAYAVFVRSRNGHGIIKEIDTAPRKRCPACSAIYTGADLTAYGTMKCAVPFKNRDGTEMKKPPRFSLHDRQGALRRRSGCGRRRRDIDAGEGRRRGGRGRYRAAARGDAARAKPQSPARRSSMTTCRTTWRSTISMAIPTRSRRRSPRPRTSPSSISSTAASW